MDLKERIFDVARDGGRRANEISVFIPPPGRKMATGKRSFSTSDGSIFIAERPHDFKTRDGGTTPFTTQRVGVR